MNPALDRKKPAKSFFILFLFCCYCCWNNILCSPGWPQYCKKVKRDLELLIMLSLPSSARITGIHYHIVGSSGYPTQGLHTRQSLYWVTSPTVSICANIRPSSWSESFFMSPWLWIKYTNPNKDIHTEVPFFIVKKRLRTKNSLN